MLNTPEAVGVQNPLFYGSTFHSLLGALGQFLGMALAFRLVAFLLQIVQFCHIERAAREAGASRFAAFIVATVTSWQVFQMLTIYERGDLTESSAFVCLTCSLSCLLVLCIRMAREEKDTYGLIATGAFYGLVAVTNPLTGFYGGMLIAAFGLVALLILKSRKLFLFGVFNALALACLLSPWLYVVHRFGKVIRIADSWANALMFQGLFATTLWTRLLSVFSPISGPFFTARSPSESSYEASARFSLALLVFLASTLIILSRCPKRCGKPERVFCSFLGLSYLTFLISLLVFCVPKCSSLFGGFFDIMQFAGRLGAYVNLSLMLCVVCMFGLIDWKNLRTQGRVGAALRFAGIGALVLAAVGLVSEASCIASSTQFGSGTKGAEAVLRAKHWPTRTDGYWIPGNAGGDTVHLNDMPAMFYWRSDYDTDSAFSTNYNGLKGLPSYRVIFRPGPSFGEVKPVEFAVTRPALLVTNVNVFPWNAIYLDGKRVPCGNLFPVLSRLGLQLPVPGALAMRVSPGQHVLRYAFRPERPWLYLRALSWLVLLAWMAAWGGVICAKRRWRNQPPGYTPYSAMDAEPEAGGAVPVLTR